MQFDSFKKPTIKANGRAYVRLFGYFSSPADWRAFLAQYRVEQVGFGLQRNGDCSVRVVDPSTGDDATLGLDIPNYITYHTHTATSRSFWNEHFLSNTKRRHRTYEVGYANASKDEFFER